MKNKIILTSDATCDIGAALQQKYDVRLFYYYLQLGDKSYIDTVEISPAQIFETWRDKKILPKTSAGSPARYLEFFEPLVQDGSEVIHFNLGSSISASHQNCKIAAEEVGNVHVIDSCNLSSGITLQIIKAAEMIEQGLSAAEIVAKIEALQTKVSASFIIDTLEFLHAGGRCSALAAFGANLLGLKPCIEVDPKEHAKMGVQKKYRGAYEKVLAQYIRDRLGNRVDLDLDRIFITNAVSPPSDIELVKNEIKKYANFKEIYITEASCTISAHCGPRTLGILFMTL